MLDMGIPEDTPEPEPGIGASEVIEPSGLASELATGISEVIDSSGLESEPTVTV
jgi:hypothetical protein